MNREEAKNKARHLSLKYDKGYMALPDSRIDSFIDKLYDDFEHRVCGECKHYNHDEDACYSDVVNKYREIKLYESSPKFGCNIGFERLEQ